MDNNPKIKAKYVAWRHTSFFLSNRPECCSSDDGEDGDVSPLTPTGRLQMARRPRSKLGPIVTPDRPRRLSPPISGVDWDRTRTTAARRVQYGENSTTDAARGDNGTAADSIYTQCVEDDIVYGDTDNEDGDESDNDEPPRLRARPPTRASTNNVIQGEDSQPPSGRTRSLTRARRALNDGARSSSPSGVVSTVGNHLLWKALTNRSCALTTNDGGLRRGRSRTRQSDVQVIIGTGGSSGRTREGSRRSRSRPGIEPTDRSRSRARKVNEHDVETADTTAVSAQKRRRTGTSSQVRDEFVTGEPEEGGQFEMEGEAILNPRKRSAAALREVSKNGPSSSPRPENENVVASGNVNQEGEGNVQMRGAKPRSDRLDRQRLPLLVRAARVCQDY